MLSSSCSNKCCDIVGKVLMLLLVLTEIATLVAVYNSHFGTGGASFGSTTGSLSIIAFAINTAVLMKTCQAHCAGDCGVK